ncbi:transcription factor TGA2.3-like isoform X2 [Salvia hispanica]|uniref:transcription factor TGA2.3-like isoform X2 n=1 Tax=Salvia hispanica TaxID=49212 RepID=UPI002009D38E|nr:transcription factor TGA2.3-like isoform X2 [Salvia hispanica]
MHSFKSTVTQQAIALTSSDVYCHSQPSFYLRGEEGSRNGARFSDLGELEQSPGNGFHHDDALNLSRSSMYNDLKSLGSAEMVSSATGIDSGQFMSHKGPIVDFCGGGGAMGSGQFENWGDSGVVADHSQQTDTSTDTDDKNQYPGVHNERLMGADSMDQLNEKIGDQKTLRRLAQNREAARKSRMRKKAYVQQLENSRLKLTQLEQELKKVRQQGALAASGYHADRSLGGNGTMAFDLDYARWLDEHQRLINDLRTAVNSHVGDSELRLLVEGMMSHYDEIFRLKTAGAKSDVFHMLSGMWKTPAERCFMWLGGFRCSEVLKILGNQIEPLTEQQLVGICNLQQSSQQAEDALSQGMEALQQSLVETLSSNALAPRNSANVADYMGQMAIAMSKLATLENFLHQADLLRRQMLQQLQRILTTRQAARALLAISDHRSRLRALSSLWLARPKE